MAQIFEQPAELYAGNGVHQLPRLYSLAGRLFTMLEDDELLSRRFHVRHYQNLFEQTRLDLPPSLDDAVTEWGAKSSGVGLTAVEGVDLVYELEELLDRLYMVLLDLELDGTPRQFAILADSVAYIADTVSDWADDLQAGTELGSQTADDDYDLSVYSDNGFSNACDDSDDEKEASVIDYVDDEAEEGYMDDDEDFEDEGLEDDEDDADYDDDDTEDDDEDTEDEEEDTEDEE